MLRVHVLLCFLITPLIVQAAHFCGGYIAWQTVSPDATNTNMITINLQQAWVWTYASSLCGSLIGNSGSLHCMSSNCSNYRNNMTQIQAPCITYDIGLGVSTGQSIVPVTLLAGSQLILGYQGTSWLALYNISMPQWSFLTSIDLTVRSDNGYINSSPTASMIAMVTVPVNVQQVLRIPMFDVDIDIVKCRWANQTSSSGTTLNDECRDVCNNIHGAQLNTSASTDNNCSLVFTTTHVGYYVVALEIEDFMPSVPNGQALSSIPLQFLVRAINISCRQPSIIGQMTNGATVQVIVDQPFSVSIIAQAGCNTTSINRFVSTNFPSNTANTSAATALGSMLYSIVFTWTPGDNQSGTTQLFCTWAIDTNNLESPQYCLNFAVNAITTTTIITASNQPINLGLILGLTIPLLLFFGILASCIAYRRHLPQLWKKFRQRFGREKATSSQQRQSQYSQDSSMDNRKAVDADSMKFRQQYINDKPQTPTSRSFYIDSFFPDSPSPFHTNSMTTTRATLMSSSHSQSTLPSVEIPTQVPSPLHSMHPLQRNSLLRQVYLQQEARNNSVF